MATATRAKTSTKAKTAKVDTPTAVTFTAESRPGMSFTYTEVDAPTTTRTSKAPEVNPHLAGIKRAIELKTSAPTKGLTLTVPKAEISKHRSWLRKGGNDAGVSILITEKEEGDSVILTFRAVERIVRKRKEKVTPEVTETVTQDQAGF